MSGSIDWLVGTLEEYITVRLEKDRITKLYFTADIINSLDQQFNNFVEKNDGELHLLIGLDQEDKNILFAITENPGSASSKLTLKKNKRNKYKGKAKRVAHPQLNSFLSKHSEKNKFKLKDFEFYKDDQERIIVKADLNDLHYS